MAAADDPAVGASDQDTSKDILSEFTDDGHCDNRTKSRKRKGEWSVDSDSMDTSSDARSRRRSPVRPSEEKRRQDPTSREDSIQAPPPAAPEAHITASGVKEILNGLGLADCGYLGRYEFRILCQHLGLNGLSASELNDLFNQLDTDSDGRIAVDDFLRVCSQPQSAQRKNQGDVQQQQQADEPSIAVEKATATGEGPSGVSSCFRSNGLLTNSDLFLVIAPGNVNEKMKNLKTKPVTLLGSLDENDTGHSLRENVLQYWDTMGIENGCDILAKLGFPVRQRWIDLRELSSALDQELCESVEHEPVLLSAVLTLKAEVCFLKDSFDESRQQAAHYFRELQRLNQRNAIMVEEMDERQHNLEQKTQSQLRELEEKHQGRINAMEYKHREEREQWILDMKDKEEFVHKLEQAESSLQSRMRQMDKENIKLKAEVDELTQMMNEVEELNRDLRQALKDATSIKKHQICSSGENIPPSISESKRPLPPVLNGDEYSGKSLSFRNGNHTELIINRSYANADDLAECWKCASTSSTKAKKRPKYTPPSTAALLKRRRLQLGHKTGQVAARLLDSTDFESEPEPLIFRSKLKKPLKKRQRLALIANRSIRRGRDYRVAPQSTRTSTSTSSEENAPASTSLLETADGADATDLARTSARVGGARKWDTQLDSLAVLERRLADERKYYEEKLKAEISVMEDEHARELKRLTERFEWEKEKFKNDNKREIDSAIRTATTEKEMALEEQEGELKKQFELEKRDLEIKWATERNMMERKFAEEKMEMMERLQNDFEEELNRVRRNVGNQTTTPENQASTSVVSMENRLRFEQVLEENSRLNSQTDGLRTELTAMKKLMDTECEQTRKLEERIAELQEQVTIWEAKCDEANRENAALYENMKQIKMDLEKKSSEFSTLQQHAEELENKCVQEMATLVCISSNDANVQSDPAVMVTMKDESVQIDPPVDPIWCPTLSKNICELESLLGLDENGFLQEMDSNENGGVEMENGLRKRLRQIREKLKEIKKIFIDQKSHSTLNADENFLLAETKETEMEVEMKEDGIVNQNRFNGNLTTRIENGISGTVDEEIDGDLDRMENGLEEAFEISSSKMVAQLTERLRDENYLLRARLLEQKRLTGQLTDRLQQQMRDTVKVSEVAQKLFSKCKSLENEQNGNKRIM